MRSHDGLHDAEWVREHYRCVDLRAPYGGRHGRVHCLCRSCGRILAEWDEGGLIPEPILRGMACQCGWIPEDKEEEV